MDDRLPLAIILLTWSVVSGIASLSWPIVTLGLAAILLVDTVMAWLEE